MKRFKSMGLKGIYLYIYAGCAGQISLCRAEHEYMVNNAIIPV